MYVVLVIVTILVSVSVEGQMVPGACPMNCFCENKMVECMSLMEFPMNLPRDTVTIKLSQMNIRDIPPNAFSYLPALETIELNNCNVQSLQGCSFGGMSSIKEIKLVKTVIENIERYAFRNLHNLSIIELNSCKIGRLKPFGFYDIKGMYIFSLINTHFRNVYNLAFYNVTNIDRMVVNRCNLSDVVTGSFHQLLNIKSLEFHENKFWNMQCGVLDDMFKATGNLIFRQNTFYCNCSVFTMLTSYGRVKYQDIIETNRCHGPEAFMNRSTLWHVTPAELGCTGLDPVKEPTCPTVSLKPKPKCPQLVDGVFQGQEQDNDGDTTKDGNFGRVLYYNFEVLTIAFLICIGLTIM